jgi:hypothetical protein
MDARDNVTQLPRDGARARRLAAQAIRDFCEEQRRRQRRARRQQAEPEDHEPLAPSASKELPANVVRFPYDESKLAFEKAIAELDRATALLENSRPS